MLLSFLLRFGNQPLSLNFQLYMYCVDPVQENLGIRITLEAMFCNVLQCIANVLQSQHFPYAIPELFSFQQI